MASAALEAAVRVLSFAVAEGHAEDVEDALAAADHLAGTCQDEELRAACQDGRERVHELRAGDLGPAAHQLGRAVGRGPPQLRAAAAAAEEAWDSPEAFHPLEVLVEQVLGLMQEEAILRKQASRRTPRFTASAESLLKRYRELAGHLARRKADRGEGRPTTPGSLARPQSATAAGSLRSLSKHSTGLLARSTPSLMERAPGAAPPRPRTASGSRAGSRRGSMLEPRLCRTASDHAMKVFCTAALDALHQRVESLAGLVGAPVDWAAATLGALEGQRHSPKSRPATAPSQRPQLCVDTLLGDVSVFQHEPVATGAASITRPQSTTGLRTLGDGPGRSIDTLSWSMHLGGGGTPGSHQKASVSTRSRARPVSSPCPQPTTVPRSASAAPVRETFHELFSGGWRGPGHDASLLPVEQQLERLRYRGVAAVKPAFAPAADRGVEDREAYLFRLEHFQFGRGLHPTHSFLKFQVPNSEGVSDYGWRQKMPLPADDSKVEVRLLLQELTGDTGGHRPTKTKIPTPTSTPDAAKKSPAKSPALAARRAAKKATQLAPSGPVRMARRNAVKPKVSAELGMNIRGRFQASRSQIYGGGDAPPIFPVGSSIKRPAPEPLDETLIATPAET